MPQASDGKIKDPYISTKQTTIVNKSLDGTGLHDTILDNSSGSNLIMLEKILVKSLDVVTLQNTIRFFLNDGSNIYLLYERIMLPLVSSPSQETSTTIIDLVAVLNVKTTDELFMNHIFWGFPLPIGMSLLCALENTGIYNVFLNGYTWDPGV